MDARIVVTGAASGIGLGIATACHRAGAQVIVVARSVSAAKDAMTTIATATGRHDGLSIEACDLSLPREILALAGRIAAPGPVDVVFANAGIQPWSRILTADGVELTFATNVLGPFVLINALVPALAASRLKTVIATGSMVHRWGQPDFSNLEARSTYDPQKVYARSKAALMLLQTEFASRLHPLGIAVHTLEPGMTRTGFARHFAGFDLLMARLWRVFMRDPSVVGQEFADFAAREGLDLAIDHLWTRGRRLKPAAFAVDAKAARRMWACCEARLAGIGIAPAVHPAGA